MDTQTVDATRLKPRELSANLPIHTEDTCHDDGEQWQ